MTEIILMTHVLLGVICVVGSVWIFVDVLHASPANERRIKYVSRVVAGAMWLAFLVAGWWYVNRYASDKALILKGPWPFAHKFFMESKEHLVILLLLLASYLPIVTARSLAADKDARKLALWVSALIVLLGLGMEGEGAVIAMGVKVALLAK